jgi:hypothetical protein
MELQRWGETVIEERCHHRSIALVVAPLMTQQKMTLSINQNNPNQGGQQNQQGDRGGKQGQDPNKKPGQQTQNPGQGGQKLS